MEKQFLKVIRLIVLLCVLHTLRVLHSAAVMRCYKRKRRIREQVTCVRQEQLLRDHWILKRRLKFSASEKLLHDFLINPNEYTKSILYFELRPKVVFHKFTGTWRGFGIWKVWKRCLDLWHHVTSGHCRSVYYLHQTNLWTHCDFQKFAKLIE